jgi:hypothetical protein
MKWMSLVSLFLASLVLIGPRFEWAIRESPGMHRGLPWTGSGPIFLMLLLVSAIFGAIYLFRHA